MTVLKKCILEVVNLLCNNSLAFFCAKRLKLFHAVFVMYPANKSFAGHYTFAWTQERIKWRPFITGIIKHPNNTRTLIFAISATEDELSSDSWADTVRNMYRHIVSIQKSVGASSNHLAGILPGRLVHLRIKRSNDEQVATVENVIKAVHQLRGRLEHDSTNVVILLGHKGFIGREVMRLLMLEGIAIVGIDVGDTFTAPNRAHLIVNITRPEVINGYVRSFTHNSVLLNEVYPAPHHDVIAEILERGGSVYHIAGVRACATPSFPFSYKGAIPCCAAIPQVSYNPIVIEL